VIGEEDLAHEDLCFAPLVLLVGSDLSSVYPAATVRERLRRLLERKHAAG